MLFKNDYTYLYDSYLQDVATINTIVASIELEIYFISLSTE